VHWRRQALESPALSDPRTLLAEIARLATEDLQLRPLLQRVADAIARRSGAEFVAFVRLDQDPPRFVCEAVTSSLPTAVHVGYGRGLGSGIVGRVAATGEEVLLDEVALDPDYVETLPGARSEICLPIRHRQRVVAVMNLESPRPAAFRADRELFREIALQLGGAIASALLLESTHRRTFELSVLSELSRRALEVEGLDERLARMASFLRSQLDLALVAFLVADERGHVWRHRAISTRAPVELPRRRIWTVGSGVVGRAVRAGEPQLVLDVLTDPDFFAVDSEVSCEYVVPFRLRSRTVGALNVESTDRSQLDSDGLALLRAVAEQAVGPIELGLAHRQLRLTNRRLSRLTRQDALTGLANRRHFDQALDLEWRRAVRQRGALAVALVDLDEFKRFNDTFGHPQGDRCLRQVAALLREAARRATDVVARFGGEEFALLLPGLDAAAAARLLEPARSKLAELALPHPGSAHGRVTFSAGVAGLRADSPADVDALLAEADAALYRAKAQGRDRTVVVER